MWRGQTLKNADNCLYFSLYRCVNVCVLSLLPDVCAGKSVCAHVGISVVLVNVGK